LTIDIECGFTDKHMPSSTSRVVPRSKDNFTWTGGWVTTTPQQAQAIASRYRPQNPNLSGSPQQEDMLDDAKIKADADMGTAQNTAQREQNAAAAEVRGNLAAASPMLPPGTNVVQPGQVAGATVPAAAPAAVVTGGGPLTNPNAGNPAAQAEQNWMDHGGSMATLHRAQVAQGRRPAIDARATPAWQDAGESASDQIRAGFGSGPGQEGHNPWPAEDFGNAGSAVWADMTRKFNASKARLQQAIKPATAPLSKFTAGSSDEDASAFNN
jgi:hypothetical protein